MNVTTTSVPSTRSTTDSPCILSEWSQWSPCSRSCGAGKRTRTRNASSIVKCGNASLIEQQTCNENVCQCVLDEAFYRRVFMKEPPTDSTHSNRIQSDFAMSHRLFFLGIIGYIESYSYATNRTQNVVYINDSIDPGITIRTTDECYKFTCSADGLTVSKNQCVTPVPPVITNCTVREYNKVPLRVENNRCVSRDTVPEQRCVGSCIDSNDEECKCCSVGTTILQPMVFDCFTDNTMRNREQRIIRIKRIQSCQCHVCKNEKR